MLTPDEIHDLIVMPKKVCDAKDRLLSEIKINTQTPINKRLEMLAIEKSEWRFLWNIQQSGKTLLKLTLHFMERGTVTDLIRIDYSGRHLQPTEINNHVPEDLITTAGTWLEYTQPHIHLNIEGYKPQAWARPLGNSFPVKEITSQQSVLDAILAFRLMIALETKINFEIPLL